ncbi:MAG: Lrp/AsnC family transcriptional regulator [Candidatus Bathyarchaeota archaeon]
MREILDIISKEGPLPTAEIATRLDVSPEEVEQTLAEARDRGILLGYRGVINWENSDTEKVFALITVQATPEHGQGFDEVASYVSHFDEVHSVYLMSGTADLMVVVEGEDFREVARFVAERLAPAPGVRDTATSFVLKTYKMEDEILGQESANHRLAVTP